MKKDSKYGENTRMVSYRVPESKVSEINSIVKLKLNEYEKSALMNSNITIFERIIYDKSLREGDLINIKAKQIAKSSWSNPVHAAKEEFVESDDVSEKKIDPADIKYLKTVAESYEGKKMSIGDVDEVGKNIFLLKSHALNLISLIVFLCKLLVILRRFDFLNIYHLS